MATSSDFSTFEFGLCCYQAYLIQTLVLSNSDFVAIRLASYVDFNRNLSGF